MSNPRHIPLSEARPGDMVFLKPRRITGVMTGMIEAGLVRYLPAEIDRIERAPRVPVVGDRVRDLAHAGVSGRVEAILDDQWAWVRWEFSGSPCTETLSTIQVIEP